MKPIVLFTFQLTNGTTTSLYFNIDQFSVLRRRAAFSIKQLFGIELRTL